MSASRKDLPFTHRPMLDAAALFGVKASRCIDGTCRDGSAVSHGGSQCQQPRAPGLQVGLSGEADGLLRRQLRPNEKAAVGGPGLAWGPKDHMNIRILIPIQYGVYADGRYSTWHTKICHKPWFMESPLSSALRASARM